MSTRRPCFDAKERADLDAFNALDPAARALVLDIRGGGGGRRAAPGGRARGDGRDGDGAVRVRCVTACRPAANETRRPGSRHQATGSAAVGRR